LPFYGEPSERMEDFLKQMPEASNLPHYDYHQVTVIEAPEEPESEDYTDTYDDKEPVFDNEGYETALRDHNTEMTEHQQNLQAGNIRKLWRNVSETFILSCSVLNHHSEIIMEVTSKELR